MIKANSPIITTNREALLSREPPYLKYRAELLAAALHPLIIDVDLHKRQSERCWIWYTGRDSVCGGVSAFHPLFKPPSTLGNGPNGFWVLSCTSGK